MENRKSGSEWSTRCTTQTSLLEIIPNLVDPVVCAMVKDFLTISMVGWKLCKFNSENSILEQKSTWTSFFEIMKNQAFPVLGVKSRMEELCGCRAMATLCWFFNLEIFWNFHFWAFWTCHRTLLKLLFYWRNDYFWNDLKWFEKMIFLNLFEMIWKRKPCA